MHGGQGTDLAPSGKPQPEIIYQTSHSVKRVLKIAFNIYTISGWMFFLEIRAGDLIITDAAPSSKRHMLARSIT